MIEIDNLYSMRKEFIGKCPYPFRAITNDHLPMGILKASPTCFPCNSEGKARRIFILFYISSTLNGCVIAHRALIPYWISFLVFSVCRKVSTLTPMPSRSAISSLANVGPNPL